MSEDKISAGELRAMGIKLSEEIPDIAEVPRSSLVWSTKDLDLEGNPRKFGFSIILTINASFEWAVINIEVEEKQNE